MIIAIFFGGIVLGFLMGFVTMALLAAANHQNRQTQLETALAYQEFVTGTPPGNLP
jgi:hypothetical protein